METCKFNLKVETDLGIYVWSIEADYEMFGGYEKESWNCPASGPEMEIEEMRVINKNGYAHVINLDNYQNLSEKIEDKCWDDFEGIRKNNIIENKIELKLSQIDYQNSREYY